VNRTDLLLLPVAVLTGCGGAHVHAGVGQSSNPFERGAPIEVVVSGGTPAVDVIELVRGAAADGGVEGAGCAVLWGDVGAAPRGAHAASISIDGRTVVTGFIACGGTAASPAPATAVVWKDGVFMDGAPPVERDPSSPMNRTVARFAVDPGDRGSTARDLAPSLEALPRRFRLVAWPLTD
jgi:hypothetical protein